MFTIVYLSEAETAAWYAQNAAVIADLRECAAHNAKRAGRRFYKIVGAYVSEPLVIAEI